MSWEAFRWLRRLRLRWAPAPQRHPDLEALRARVDEAKGRLDVTQRLVAGWQNLIESNDLMDEPEKARARELLQSFRRDLDDAMSDKQRAEDALKDRLIDLFRGVKGRTPENDQELAAWLASPEGRAATAFETTTFESWGGRGRA